MIDALKEISSVHIRSKHNTNILFKGFIHFKVCNFSSPNKSATPCELPLSWLKCTTQICQLPVNWRYFVDEFDLKDSRWDQVFLLADSNLLRLNLFSKSSKATVFLFVGLRYINWNFWDRRSQKKKRCESHLSQFLHSLPKLSEVLT